MAITNGDKFRGVASEDGEFLTAYSEAREIDFKDEFPCVCGHDIRRHGCSTGLCYGPGKEVMNQGIGNNLKTVREECGCSGWKKDCLKHKWRG